MSSHSDSASNNQTTYNQTSTPDYLSNGRDLRLDFLRGMIMILVIVVHLEYYSLFSMFAWERIGLISSAEGFVGLSGIVLGLVYRRKLVKLGFKQITILLWKRAFQLYRVNVWLIISIGLLGSIPLINVFQVTHWINPLTNQAWSYFQRPAAPGKT
jgi:hypothetical protein